MKLDNNGGATANTSTILLKAASSDFLPHTKVLNHIDQINLSFCLLQEHLSTIRTSKPQDEMDSSHFLCIIQFPAKREAAILINKNHPHHTKNTIID